MHQRSPIFAPLISGTQYPDGKVAVEYIGHPAESKHKGIHVEPGIYIVLYDTEGRLRGVRSLKPENDRERDLFESKNLEAIARLYESSNLSFRNERH